MSNDRQQDENPDFVLEEGAGDAGREPPVFNLPGPVLAALGLIIGIHLLMVFVLPLDFGAWLSVELGFSPIRYVVPLSEQSPAWLWTPITYSLLHGGWQHLAFNSLWLAAFGTPVARRIGAVRFVVFWMAAAAAAAGLHLAVNWGAASLLVGASGVIAALMGGACRFAFAPRSIGGTPRAGQPLLSVGESLRIKTVRVFVLIWFLGNIAIAVGLPVMGAEGAIVAWDAHIGGFLFGFLCFPLCDREVSRRYP